MYVTARADSTTSVAKPSVVSVENPVGDIALVRILHVVVSSRLVGDTKLTRILDASVVDRLVESQSPGLD